MIVYDGLPIGKEEIALLIEAAQSLGLRGIYRISGNKDMVHLNNIKPEGIPVTLFIYHGAGVFYSDMTISSPDKVDKDDIRRWMIDISLRKLEMGGPYG